MAEKLRGKTATRDHSHGLQGNASENKRGVREDENCGHTPAAPARVLRQSRRRGCARRRAFHPDGACRRACRGEIPDPKGILHRRGDFQKNLAEYVRGGEGQGGNCGARCGGAGGGFRRAVHLGRRGNSLGEHDTALPPSAVGDIQHGGKLAGDLLQPLRAREAA